MEHYSLIRGWLINTAQKLLGHDAYLTIHEEIVKMEAKGESARSVVRHALKRLHELMGED